MKGEPKNQVGRAKVAIWANQLAVQALKIMDSIYTCAVMLLE